MSPYKVSLMGCSICANMLMRYKVKKNPSEELAL